MLRSFLLISLFSGSLLLHACNNSDYSTAVDKKDTTAATPDNTEVKTPDAKDTAMTGAPVMVGNDADKHGCKASAGYSWSVLKNDCIRIFDGIRLDPKDASLNQTLVAYLVFKNENDDTKAEVFIPGHNGSVVMERTKEKDAAGTWLSGTLKLEQWKGMYSLSDGKKLIYEGLAVR